MSDKFQPLTMRQLAAWTFTELAGSQSLFGIPRDLFFRPSPADRFRSEVYGQLLETPFGVAAGPHTQMAQNLVTAWLCGARFLELKTIQTLDELEISKPCIDMPDEGYNVEWSQELKVHESFEEYLRAWVLIHALHHKLGFPGERPGTIFNMSVGYNMEGVLKPNVQWFLEKMRDAGEALGECIEAVAEMYPAVRDLDIPSRLSDNVTLSTMHGCPPEEIETISAYLMREWKLHTNVKLNPTLLGPEGLRGILNDDLGFKQVEVPDEAFGHDLKYRDALRILANLRAVADEVGVRFGVKLSNTLEVVNHRTTFDAKEKMMYMSGRPLHAVTVNVAAKLAAEFDGALAMSYSAGADAFNVDSLLACGMKTITVCSDILRTGGYLRMTQYIENVNRAFDECGAGGIEEFIVARASESDDFAEMEETDAAERVRLATLENLERYADAVRRDPALMRDTYERTRTKTNRPLGLFDCIEAPCTDECPVNQKVPQYMELVREGRLDEAIDLTRADNPLSAVLGRACNHLCEQVCVRTQIDEPLAIREIKRFIMAQEASPHHRARRPARDVRVAVIGGGPCGLSAAYFLAQQGFAVTVFEARDYPGGMVAGTIPGYRASNEVMEQDLKILRGLGVEIRCGVRAGRDFTLRGLRSEGYKHIAIAAGAQRGMGLGLEGEDADGVFDGLEFLRQAKHGTAPSLGARVGIVGGGDVAMDCARSAARLTSGKAVVIYRRTIEEMPAQREELKDLFEEEIEIMELAAPKRIAVENGKLKALVCARMRLGEPDASGRKRPVEVPGSDFEVPLDSLILAIGQQADFDFFGDEAPALNRKGYIEVDPETFETSIPGLFAGGDAVDDGPATIVRALGDGRRIAYAITRREDPEWREPEVPVDMSEADPVDLIRRKARRQFRVSIPHKPVSERVDFSEVIHTLSREAAQEEASRCLDCHLMCSICTSVCPNRAILTYQTRPLHLSVPAWRAAGGAWETVAGLTFEVAQRFQIAIQTDFCNECGNCATFCPTAGSPYRDKPRLYLRRAEFEAQADNAFMLTRTGEAWALKGRFGGQTHEILMNDVLEAAGPGRHARLDPQSLAVVEVTNLPKPAADGEVVEWRECAVLFALLTGLCQSIPYVPTAVPEEYGSSALDA